MRSASSRSFLDLIDVIGDQTVGLPVDIRSSLGRGSLDQAEHLASSLIDPVPQVAHVVGSLGLQVGEVRLSDVIHRNSTIDLVNIHEERHFGAPFLGRRIPTQTIVGLDDPLVHRRNCEDWALRIPVLRRAIA